MTEKKQNLQDTFLNSVRKSKTPLTIFLVNGVKLQGVVSWFDNFCVLLRRDGQSQLVYKHAISTIMPAQPVQLYEPFTDEEGNLSSRPVCRDGQPVLCREAVARRDRLIEKLASLPPVHGALDQIVQRFGTEMVAEVTGRSRRIVRKTAAGGIDRLAVENRPASANLAETQAFMDDAKRILVFSDAGGTGRSYHADLAAKNRRLRGFRNRSRILPRMLIRLMPKTANWLSSVPSGV